MLPVGFQAPRTRGDRLANGAETIRMLGGDHAVRAQIESVELSTHADRSELIGWLRTANAPKRVYVNHGEAAGSESLARVIESELGCPPTVPEPGLRLHATSARPVP